MFGFNWLLLLAFLMLLGWAYVEYRYRVERSKIDKTWPKD